MAALPKAGNTILSVQLGLSNRGGERIAEALALSPEDVDPDAGTVRILVDKGCKARTIRLDYGAMAVIQRWLDVRSNRRIRGHSPLFCTLQGKHGLRSGFAATHG